MKVSEIVSFFIRPEKFDWQGSCDEIVQALRDDPELRAEIEKRLPQGQMLSCDKEYFCSQLAGVLLWRGGLISKDPGIITPCGLHDLLNESGWQDVTAEAYGDELFRFWDRNTPPDHWKEFYKGDCASAQLIRQSEHVDPMLERLGDNVNDLSARIDLVRKKLDAVSL